jgi:hypothetical protein
LLSRSISQASTSLASKQNLNSIKKQHNSNPFILFAINEHHKPRSRDAKIKRRHRRDSGVRYGDTIYILEWFINRYTWLVAEPSPIKSLLFRRKRFTLKADIAASREATNPSIHPEKKEKKRDPRVSVLRNPAERPKTSRHHRAPPPSSAL